MIANRIAIPVAIAVLIILTLIPACAFAAGGTISGKVAIPANATLPEYINTTVDANNVSHTEITQKIGVTRLTVFAFNTKTGFSNTTQPNADGSYNISVPENGIYRIHIVPSEVIDLVNPSNWTLAQYPDLYDRVYLVSVSGDVKNVDINNYPPGQYVQPTGMPTETPSSTPTATPAPGFAVLLVMAAILGACAFAIVRRNK